MIDNFFGAKLDEIKKGYCFDEEKQAYICLVCGKVFKSGEVFPSDGRFFDAPAAAGIHIEKEHGNMLGILTSFDKKYTGLTDNQKELLFMMYDGMTDKEISEKTGAAAATLRHQRFVFREKAKQSKLFLSIFEIVDKAASEKKSKGRNDEFMDIQISAKMVDDRYFITKAEEEKIASTVFESLNPLRLKVFSSKEKKKVVILRKIYSQFEPGRKYSEKEVNEILRPIYGDYVTIRRYLIEYGFMGRTNDCSEYWII